MPTDIMIYIRCRVSVIFVFVCSFIVIIFVYFYYYCTVKKVVYKLTRGWALDSGANSRRLLDRLQQFLQCVTL